jgi:asparagine synthase (glutamine-hydrolysing)
MAETLKHRGPNDAGLWADADAGIALSMRRLAILDLSPAGHQPMHSASGRYVLVFNGEIYNYEDLKNELLGEEHPYLFRGTSDTEVMLACFDKWGIEQSVARFNGMFAFAVWDRHERGLTLGRDRYGEKPLYFSRCGRQFIFGSELKALRAYSGFSDEIDPHAVALFVRHSCVPAPYSIYKNTCKLPPASLLKVSANDFTREPHPYWSLRSVIDEAVSNPIQCRDDEAVEQLDFMLRDAVRLRMRSDVPLGAFLSGGIDSSTVVALIQAQSGKARTFSLGNNDRELDEAKQAAEVARHLCTEHTQFYVTSEEAVSVIPSLPRIYDEPFSDSSQIPTILVSRLAREHVTVALSGDGGDEVFGGYTRHIWSETVSHLLKNVPSFVRKCAASVIRTISPEHWDFLFQTCGPALPSTWRQRMPGYKLHKLAHILESHDVHTLYERLSCHRLDSGLMLSDTVAPGSPDRHWPLNNATEEMMYLDAVRYLPDDILVKLDRATMSVGLEGRAPFLDHRIAEFAWRLPLKMRIRERQGKWILRQVLHRYVPQALVDRPKSGFGIPLATWLRGQLRDWAESLLDETRLRQGGYFDPSVITKMWREHLASRMNWEYQLWDVLMFQAWMEDTHVVTTNVCTHDTGVLRA